VIKFLPLQQKHIMETMKPRSRRDLSRIRERLIAFGIRAGGMTIILSILSMFILMAAMALPLWRPARLEVSARFSLPAVIPEAVGRKVMAIGGDEHRRIGFVLDGDGVFHFLDLINGRPVVNLTISAISTARVTSIWQSRDGRFMAIGTARGEAVIGSVSFPSRPSAAGSVLMPTIDFSTVCQLDTAAQPIVAIAFCGEAPADFFVAGITADRRIVTYAREKARNLLSEGIETVHRQWLPTPEARPTHLAVGDSRDALFIGCDNGTLIQYWVENKTRLAFAATHSVSHQRITSLGFLCGGRSLVAGDAMGHSNVFFSTLDADSKSGRRFRLAHRLPELDGPIALQTASARNRTSLAASVSGDIGLFFSTNERLLYRGHLTDSPPTHAIFTPKADGLLIVDAQQNMYQVALDNPHPEANWQAFFGKIWYEGYDRPAYVWQSSGGSDDVEAKLSLVPLVFGTLKGTLGALLFALPLALGSALYVSQFMNPHRRKVVKPAIEMMAALPSVVLGFLAALWLAPLMQKIMPAILLMILMLPALTILSAFAWTWLRDVMPFTRAIQGKEWFFLIPVLLAGIWLCLQLNGAIENLLFAGDFKQWLVDAADLTYDQRNAFVVGLAMSFAVIPIVFTISEESLANVPSSLAAASLALGATPWQTTLRVVLPTASPGILSAIMIGFGRAVGETMIVLMATGNTPIMNFNIFDGFRTLAANIAVEIPEAPVGGTLFRALFLMALLLFLMSFVVNTIADIVRQRMRQKYSHL
jgi:phosphate transport system permease protein